MGLHLYSRVPERINHYFMCRLADICHSGTPFPGTLPRVGPLRTQASRALAYIVFHVPRALYVSHTGMTEPLGQSQVVPYVAGLARAGWDMEIVAFEPDTASIAEIQSVRRQLQIGGVGYSWTRRSRSHALAVKLKEANQAFVRLLALAFVRRPQIVHARSYLPAAVASVVAAVSPGRPRFIFDVRGLLGEEYVDAGHWASGSFRFKLVKQVERRLFARANGVVVLTERHRRWLHAESKLLKIDTPIEVIPCCVDLDRFRAEPGDRARTREELGAGDRFVLAYSGTLGSWYRADDMARLFAAIRARRPAMFAVYTRSDPVEMTRAFAGAGVRDEDVRFIRVAPADMPRFLAAADAAVSFITPCLSKLGSSPTKVAEYLAMGLPVVLNRGIGDSDLLIDETTAVVDAGSLTPSEIESAADQLLKLDLHAVREEGRRVAIARFSLESVGIVRYQRLYDRLL
jgi:glycosyltransferase involved in cell wall biosynthesis